MKKLIVYLIMILCYFASYCLFEIINIISEYGTKLPIVAFALTILFSIDFAFVSFYSSQKISISVKGLRYKLFSVFTIIIGVITGISALTAVYPDFELFDIFTRPIMLFLLLISLINPAFIFGISLFALYKKNYKNNLTNRL